MSVDVCTLCATLTHYCYNREDIDRCGLYIYQVDTLLVVTVDIVTSDLYAYAKLTHLVVTEKIVRFSL